MLTWSASAITLVPAGPRQLRIVVELERHQRNRIVCAKHLRNRPAALEVHASYPGAIGSLGSGNPKIYKQSKV